MMPRLFIGGPFDGDWRVQEDYLPLVAIAVTGPIRTVDLMPAEEVVPIRSVRYRREVLHAGARHFVVWVHDDLNIIQAMEKLLDGYLSGPSNDPAEVA